MLRLFKLQIIILDDLTFSPAEMQENVQEALDVHLEAIKVQTTLVSADEVIVEYNGADMPELPDA
jgi:hypothetical protein